MPESSGACRVIWVRHAAPLGEGRFLGHLDVALSAQGKRQLPALAKRLSSYAPAAIYSSDLERARETANFIARRRKLEVKILAGLREIHFGDWEGLEWAEVAHRFPDAARKWTGSFPRVHPPAGEPFVIFKRRVLNTIQEIVAAHPGGRVIVVAHAGVIRVALASALGIPDRRLFRITQDYGRVSVIDYFAEAEVVECMNA